MKWIRVPKSPAFQPDQGTYKDWKSRLAEEASNQCVYCAIHEVAMGGIRNFHVEHFRPKSIFPDLINDYSNLFYSCPICNTFKSNDWPRDPLPDNSTVSYPNPSEIDYNNLFDIDYNRGLLSGRNTAALYIQEKIFLNRPQLIFERRIDYILQKLTEELDELGEDLKSIPEDSPYRKFSIDYIDLTQQHRELLDRLRITPRYRTEDVQRQ